MFTLNERDTHRMPTPLKTHLPIKPDIVSSGIMEEDGNATEAEVDFPHMVTHTDNFYLGKHKS